METYDTVIIGAGLAGLQCARLLSKQGLRVMLVDRKRSLEQKVHTTGIFVRRTLVDFDIPDDCLGPAIRHVILYSPSHKSMELVSKHDEFRVGRMSQIYARYLNQCLRAGVHWVPDTSYVDLKEAGSNLVVRLNEGATTRSVTTRYLIGADGACSRVARDLDLDQNSEWIIGVEDVVTGVRLDGPPRLLCFLDPTLAPGYIAWIAHDGEETHVGVGGYRARFDPIEALGLFQERVKGIVDLSHARLIERRGGRIPVGGILRRIANSRGLLIGDAAGAVSPLTAGGLDPCMRLSTFAAEVVIEYLTNNNCDALTAYSGSLFRSRFASRLWARRIAAGVHRPELAELACAGLRLPLVRKLAHHVFFGRGSFPDVPTHFSHESMEMVAAQATRT